MGLHGDSCYIAVDCYRYQRLDGCGGALHMPIEEKVCEICGAFRTIDMFGFWHCLPCESAWAHVVKAANLDCKYCGDPLLAAMTRHQLELHTYSTFDSNIIGALHCRGCDCIHLVNRDGQIDWID